MAFKIEISSQYREQVIDVTDKVNQVIAEAQVTSGICYLFIPHTTCAVTINEGFDPDVAADILAHLNSVVPRAKTYRHQEGNADAHIKSVLVGSSISVPIEGRRLALGQWQRVLVCEFDGPRRRRLNISVIAT
ncbi:MAG: YjbQ family protein [Clostridia bacterium]|nr:YjbQ family protein [Clostridia bacterium]